MSLLEVKNLILFYKTVRGVVKAVNKVSFNLSRGEALGIVGESGCGKSSTVNAIMRLLPTNTAEYSGTLNLDGVNLMKMSDDEIRKKIRWKRISMIFQGAMNALNPVLKVGFQAAEPLIVHENLSKKEAIKRVREVFKDVGIPPEYVDRYPHELSGGQKQRVVIAMSLVMSPDIIILDEPTSALDVSIQAQIMNLLKQLKKEKNISMIFITHDIALASDLCDRLAVMYAGEIVELGSAEDILLSPKHPYSEKLIASVPRLREDYPVEFIPGAPPDLVNPPSGCKFHPRCHKRIDKCDKDVPPYFMVNGHQVKCWLYELYKEREKP